MRSKKSYRKHHSNRRNTLKRRNILKRRNTLKQRNTLKRRNNLKRRNTLKKRSVKKGGYFLPGLRELNVATTNRRSNNDYLRKFTELRLRNLPADQIINHIETNIENWNGQRTNTLSKYVRDYYEIFTKSIKKRKDAEFNIVAALDLLKGYHGYNIYIGDTNCRLSKFGDKQKQILKLEGTTCPGRYSLDPRAPGCERGISMENLLENYNFSPDLENNRIVFIKEKNSIFVDTCTPRDQVLVPSPPSQSETQEPPSPPSP